MGIDDVAYELLGHTLTWAAATVREVNEANGWFDEDRSVGDDIALLHSEVSEAFEEFRSHGLDDVTFDKCCSKARIKTSQQVHDDWFLNTGHLCKPEGFGSEMADVLVRLLDTCSRHNIDLGAEFKRKLEYNRTRGYKHGGKRV